jgi:UDP-N-acetylglucosamine acyltransferase
MDNTVHPTAIIGEGVDLGKGNYIGPYCLIGMPCESRANWGKPGKVVIGNNNVFTGHVTVDAGMDGETAILTDCFIMKHAHIGHDALVGHNVTISPGAVVGGHATICNNVNLGINASVHQRVKIPPDCMIGMGAVITKKTAMRPGYKYAGVPARELGPNVKNP